MGPFVIPSSKLEASSRTSAIKKLHGLEWRIHSLCVAYTKDLATMHQKANEFATPSMVSRVSHLPCQVGHLYMTGSAIPLTLVSRMGRLNSKTM